MNNWDTLFPAHILERGREYYDSGAVVYLSKTDYGYAALVEGGQDYTVKIELSRQKIIDMECTCPYADDGHYCKHMAAVLYAISSSGQLQDPDADQGNTALQELPGLIQAIPEDELRAELLSICLQDEHIRNRIICRFASSNNGSYPPELNDELEVICSRYADRGGYIDWKHAPQFGIDIVEFLIDHAEAMMSQSNCRQAFELTMAVIFAVGDLEIDDSGGELSYIASICSDLWDNILDTCSVQDQEFIFQRFETLYSDDALPEFAEDTFGDFFFSRFQSEKQLRRELEILKRQLEQFSAQSAGPGQYNLEYNITNQLSLMQKLGFEQDEIQAFADQYLSIPSIRDQSVSAALAAGNTSKAIRLLQEGKQLCADDRHKEGLLAKYSAELIDIYEKTGQSQKCKEELIFQICSCWQRDLTFVLKLKSICTVSEWELYFQKILASGNCSSIVYSLLEHEKKYKELLMEIERRAFLPLLDQYEMSLKAVYPERVRDLYIRFVNRQMDLASTRSQYREPIRYLKKIKTYPDGVELANRVAAAWQAQYYRRPAMLDELKRAGFAQPVNRQKSANAEVTEDLPEQFTFLSGGKQAHRKS